MEKNKTSLLAPFPEIFKFKHEKYNKVQLKPVRTYFNPGIEIRFVQHGRYEGKLEGKHYTLYPQDVLVTMPWQFHENETGFVDLGSIYQLIILPEAFNINGELKLRNIDVDLANSIGKAIVSCEYLIIKNGSFIGRILEELANEISNRPFGYVNRVYFLLNDLLISVVRGLSNETFKEEINDFDLKGLDDVLKMNLDHTWTVSEMADIVNRGVTSFTELIKIETGYTPLNYLINLRINEAKNMLLSDDMKINDIACKCGFSSSQHFSNTFKQRTGIQPSHFKTYSERLFIS